MFSRGLRSVRASLVSLGVWGNVSKSALASPEPGAPCICGLLQRRGRRSIDNVPVDVYFRTKYHEAPVLPSLMYLRIETLRDSTDRDWILSRLAPDIHNMNFKFLYTGNSTSTRSQNLRDGWMS